MSFMHQYASREYDWVDPSSTRTPREYPYSHSEYFIWREFSRPAADVEACYTDRMRQWDAEKYALATSGKMTNFNSVPVSREAALEIVRDYFGSDFSCVGVAQSMNVSNGYPLGAFFIRRNSHATQNDRTSTSGGGV